MKRVLLLLFVLTSTNCFAAPCKETTSLALNECLSEKVESAERELETYITKIQNKYSDQPAAVKKLIESQKKWNAFRKAYCKAVYETLSEGTIGNAAYARCLLKQTRQRARDLWQDYLTYWDSSPPDLPEPSLSDEPM